MKKENEISTHVLKNIEKLNTLSRKQSEEENHRQRKQPHVVLQNEIPRKQYEKAKHPQADPHLENKLNKGQRGFLI